MQKRGCFVGQRYCPASSVAFHYTRCTEHRRQERRRRHTFSARVRSGQLRLFVFLLFPLVLAFDLSSALPFFMKTGRMLFIRITNKAPPLNASWVVKVHCVRLGTRAEVRLIPENPSVLASRRVEAARLWLRR